MTLNSAQNSVLSVHRYCVRRKNHNLGVWVYLGWKSVTYMYHFGVTVTLTSGLSSRIIMLEAYLLHLSDVGITNLVCGCIFRVAECIAREN